MEKLLPVEEIFEKLEQNGLHQPKNQFPLARKSVFTSQNKGFVAKNKFTLGGKNLSLPRVFKK